MFDSDSNPRVRRKCSAGGSRSHSHDKGPTRKWNPEGRKDAGVRGVRGEQRCASGSMRTSLSVLGDAWSRPVVACEAKRVREQ